MIARPVRLILGLTLVLALAACDFPRDPNGTLQRVETSGEMRTGIIDDSNNAEASLTLAQSIAQVHSAQPLATQGSAETLLHSLERGDLDIVIGAFAEDSPWTGRVAFTDPANSPNPPDHQPALRAIVQTGENGWLMAVSKAIEGAAP